MSESLLQLQAEQLLPVNQLSSERILVIDSFAVRCGKVVAIDLHQQRFAKAVGLLAPELMMELPAFWRAAFGFLRASQGFPRFELVQTPDGFRLRLRLRPLEQLCSTATVLIGCTGDLRRCPHLKGYDLLQCQTWQSMAKSEGYEEYLICNEQGLPLEGAYSALLWWQDNILCALPEQAAVLPSITQRVLLQLAKERGLAITRFWPTLAQLQSCEVWLLNARHGVRLVSAWSNGQSAIAQSNRREYWQKIWLESAQMLG